MLPVFAFHTLADQSKMFEKWDSGCELCNKPRQARKVCKALQAVRMRHQKPGGELPVLARLSF